MTWADVTVFNVLSELIDPTNPFYVQYMHDNLGDERIRALKDSPGLVNLIERVASEPNIKKWLEKRPRNEDSPV